MNIENWSHIDIMASIYFSHFLIIGLVLLAAWKYRQLGHPATYLAVGVNLFNCLLEPLGKSEAVQSLLLAMIRKPSEY